MEGEGAAGSWPHLVLCVGVLDGCLVLGDLVHLPQHALWRATTGTDNVQLASPVSHLAVTMDVAQGQDLKHLP